MLGFCTFFGLFHILLLFSYFFPLFFSHSLSPLFPFFLGFWLLDFFLARSPAAQIYRISSPVSYTSYYLCPKIRILPHNLSVLLDNLLSRCTLAEKFSAWTQSVGFLGIVRILNLIIRSTAFVGHNCHIHNFHFNYHHHHYYQQRS